MGPAKKSPFGQGGRAVTHGGPVATQGGPAASVYPGVLATSFTKANIAQDVNTRTNASCAPKATTRPAGVGLPPKLGSQNSEVVSHPANTKTTFDHALKANVPPPSACPSLPTNIKALPTPINVQRLATWLKGYPRDKLNYLIEGFSQGFSLEYEGDRSPKLANNHKSALSSPDIVSQKIEREIAAGRVAGPFTRQPANLIVSPLGLVPKNSGGFRLIHNLSYSNFVDITAPSINEGISPDSCRVHYAGIDEAIVKVKECGRNCWLSKSDIKDAFKLVPIRPEDYHLQGFEWQGHYYYDKTLAMGCSISCRIFEAFSSALEWILVHKFNLNAVIHILDDFLFIEPSRLQCLAALDKFIWLANQLGVPIAYDKTLGPAQVLTFVGITLDTMRMETRLPPDKVTKAQDLLRIYSHKRSVTLRTLQSILGFLNFCCRVIQPGRCFLRRLTNLTIGTVNPNHYISLNAPARADMVAWLEFLDGFNLSTMFMEERWLSSETLHLYTDAAASAGFGAVFGSRWFYGAFPHGFRDCNITFLEFVPIVMAITVWAKLIRNHCIMFHTDNAALVAIINKQSSRHPHVMAALRRLVVTCLQFNINFRAKHVPGVDNAITDALSRFQFQKFRELAPQCQPNPTVIPPHLQPATFFKQCRA